MTKPCAGRRGRRRRRRAERGDAPPRRSYPPRPGASTARSSSPSRWSMGTSFPSRLPARPGPSKRIRLEIERRTSIPGIRTSKPLY
jgi:hypothetical protein